MTRDTTPTPATVIPTREPHNRHQWEQAVIASSLHHTAKHVALTLSHFAGDAGYLPAGGPQHGEEMAAATGHGGRWVRQALTQLEVYRLISRPNIHSWSADRGVRPITLTLPLAPRPLYAEDGAVRTEPGHPSPAAS